MIRTTARLMIRKNGKRRLRDVEDVLSRHALEHEQVEPDRRRDLRHLHHQHDEDAVPDHVDACLHDQRLNDRRGQHNHRDAVEEAAQDDVEDHQREQQRVDRQLHRCDPAGDLPRLGR